MNTLKKIRADLQELACPITALSLRRFYKTNKGEYAEKDKFLGISVPKQRKLAIVYSELAKSDLKLLLASSLHEERLTALLILILQYKKAVLSKQTTQQKQIYNFYLANISRINNWDLVDLSAPYILGAHLLDKNKEILHKLITSKNLWKRRIAIVATWQFIRNNYFTETLLLAEKILCDKEDLMHKACGWMLREVGKRDFEVLNNFLRKHYKNMPRTMLRYAIEKHPEKLRLDYLRNKI